MVLGVERERAVKRDFKPQAGVNYELEKSEREAWAGVR